MFASSRYRAVSGTVGRLDAPRVVPPGAPRARLASRIYVSFQTRNRSANGHKRGEVSGRVSESPSARARARAARGGRRCSDDRTPSSSLGVGTTRWASGGVINHAPPDARRVRSGRRFGAPSDGSRGWSGARSRAGRAAGSRPPPPSAPRVDSTNVGFLHAPQGWMERGRGPRQGQTGRHRTPPRVEKSIQARRRRRVPSLGHVVGEISPGERKPPRLTPDDPSRALARRTTTSPRRTPRRDGGEGGATGARQAHRR